jgi:hypothetical protein
MEPYAGKGIGADGSALIPVLKSITKMQLRDGKGTRVLQQGAVFQVPYFKRAVVSARCAACARLTAEHSINDTADMTF